MVNSFWYIYRRTYFLLDAQKTAYNKAIYREGMFLSELKHTSEFIPVSQALKISQQKNVNKLLLKSFGSPEEHWFWKNATDDLRYGLLFSFYLRKIKNHLKMPNVETADWTKQKSILDKYEELLEKTKIHQISEPSLMLESIFRTTGKHFRNLRFGHIHLTLDMLENRQVWGIHWDASVVKTLDYDWLIHFLSDDMPS